MNIELHDFQKDALKHILNVNKSCLFLQTGMGKTVVSLIYLKILDVKAVVILENRDKMEKIWIAENNKFNIGLDISVDYRAPAKILLVTYDYIKNNSEILDEYDVVVMDEVHCICDVSTQRHKSLKKIIRKKKRAVLLAGYPVENHLTEIYGVISMISDCLGYSFNQFLDNYFHVRRSGNRIIGTKPKQYALDAIIQKIKSFSFIADKSEMLENVNKNNLVTRFKLSDYQKNMINELRTAGSYHDTSGVNIDCKNELVVFGKIMQIVSGFVYNIDDDEERFPIYFDENPKLDLIDNILKNKSNYLLWYLFDAENEMLDRYKNDKICKLLKLQKDSRGLNLQHYDFAVYYTVPLSGGQFFQATDRLYRMGRDKDVNSIIVVPEDAFGDRMLSMIDRKHKLTKNFINQLLNTQV